MNDIVLPGSARAMTDAIASKRLSVVQVAQECLARISAQEDAVRAWAWYDPEVVLREAARLDDMVASGQPLGPLHGLPIGIKDIIDTAGFPTENGCSMDRGRIPDADAWIVTQLKAAGALLFGKTVTTELAFLHPSKTRNPLNLEHTPGGSSAGSAAAVACGMVPIALGTQTGGSVIRPASFCGVVGLKASFGTLPTQGVLCQSPSLDTLGIFTKNPDDAALVMSVLREAAGMSPDEQDREVDGPVFGWIEMPGWDRAEAVTKEGFARLARVLTDRIVPLDLPHLFSGAAGQRAIINAVEMAEHFTRYYGEDGSHLGPETRAAIEEGQGVEQRTYAQALDYRDALRRETPALFEKCDVVICPAALGPAPKTLASTGDSIFNGLWTMTGEPAITLPLIPADHGLSVGVQLVAPMNSEDKLLRVARWLWQRRDALVA